MDVNDPKNPALRIASSCYIVSEPAVLVIASVSMYPIKELKLEVKQQRKSQYMYFQAPAILLEQRKMEQRSLVLKEWINHKHGEVNFCLTQFLGGNSNFNSYLWLQNGKGTKPSRSWLSP